MNKDDEEEEHLLESPPELLPQPVKNMKHERLLRLSIFTSVLFNIVLIAIFMFADRTALKEPAPIKPSYQDGFFTDLGISTHGSTLNCVRWC